MSYEKIAENIKHDLDTELGMTFSVGLSVNKVLAKVGSKWKKPSGLTIIPKERIKEFLEKISVGKIWGIGENTTAYMNKLGIKTALDFYSKDKSWVEVNFTKPIQEIHSELLGEFIYPLTSGVKTSYASISKTRTFTPPSKDKKFVLSQLSKNVENACIKSRRHGLFASKFSYFLKTQDFKYFGTEIDLKTPTSVPQDIMEVLLKSFDELFESNILYRATGVTLLNLKDNPIVTMDLFGKSLQNNNLQEVYSFADKISLKYGKHSVFLCSSLSAMSDPQHQSDRGDLCSRKKQLLKGETSRQRLGIPFLGETR
jgi:DNA polymerase-4/DNA polymerase V